LTRLISEQVLKIPATLASYDRQLEKKIGWNLKELALAAAGFDSAAIGISRGAATRGYFFSAKPNNDANDLPSASSESSPGLNHHTTLAINSSGTPSALPNLCERESGRDTKPTNDFAPTVKKVQASVNSAAATAVAPATQRLAVIPITTGEGTIKGFSEAVCAIAAHLSFPAAITNATDLTGLVEAYREGASIAIMADDHCYAAFNLLTRRVACNDEATAKGYTVALQKMAGGLAGKDVFLIGAGPLGTAAAKALLEEEASLIIYDLAREKEAALAESFDPEARKQIIIGLTLEQALLRTNLIFDASPGDAFIPATLLKPDACIAAPGLPLGLDPAAASLHADRLIHDPLQIGTAVMLFQALSPRRLS
jgi:3-methylornithyl-N6-L-lysine dehydrogenase